MIPRLREGLQEALIDGGLVRVARTELLDEFECGFERLLRDNRCLWLGIDDFGDPLGHGLLFAVLEGCVCRLSSRPGWSGDGDGVGVGIVARLDAVSSGEEGVESLDEGGVTMEEVRDTFDDSWGIDPSTKGV